MAMNFPLAKDIATRETGIGGMNLYAAWQWHPSQEMIEMSEWKCHPPITFLLLREGYGDITQIAITIE